MKGRDIITLVCEWADSHNFSQGDLLDMSVSTLFNVMIERDRAERYKSIKEWYTATYPADELGYEINEHANFTSVYEVIDNHEIMYSIIGVVDSVVRERIFEKLADIMNVSYEYIYNEWLNGC